jgi:uncharacterized protein YcfL
MKKQIILFLAVLLFTGCGGVTGASLRQNEDYRRMENNVNGENMTIECIERCEIPSDLVKENFQKRTYIDRDVATTEQKQCIDTCLKPNRPELG